MKFPAMSSFFKQFQRLYLPPAENGTDSASQVSWQINFPATEKIDPAGDTTRVMALVFARSQDWPAVESVLKMLTETLELPTPALSVDGKDGFCLWLSLASPTPTAQAEVFLRGLCRQALPELPAQRYRCYPGDLDSLAPVPLLCQETGRWSAFIDPTLGSLFMAEAGLELGPNPDRQADWLGTLKSIPDDALQQAMTQLQPPLATPGTSTSSGLADETATNPVMPKFNDPREFLLAVMNNETLDLACRVEAAKVLMPYFHRPS